MEEYFIGIEVPSPHKEKIMKFRKESIDKGLLKFKERYFPHITIYAQGFDDEKELLNLFDFEFKEFKLNLTKINVFRKKVLKDILHIISTNPQELQKIQDKIIGLLNPIRNNALPEIILQSKEPLTERERELIQKYGYPHIKEFYRPHVTIGTFKEREKLKETIDFFNNLDFPLEFRVNKISLFKKVDGLWKEIKSIQSIVG